MKKTTYWWLNKCYLNVMHVVNKFIYKLINAHVQSVLIIV